ncbi:unnamed protein product [marine sediment metagenome]|uniref:Uncharacterized protein n=1 Tax=marine sediment metagenome TaxID=412755 RepID=X1G2F4_9ZZZZ
MFVLCQSGSKYVILAFTCRPILHGSTPPQGLLLGLFFNNDISQATTAFNPILAERLKRKWVDRWEGVEVPETR